MANRERAHITHDDPDIIPDQLKSLQCELQEERARTGGSLADFTNFRRRIQREGETVRRDGARAILLPLLLVLDDFERALATAYTDRAFYDGAASIHRLFVAAIREVRAEPIDSVGKPFDPTIHEAIATSSAAGAETRIVAREERRGWRLEGGS